MKEVVKLVLLGERQNSLNLSLYFNKYPPTIIYPEVLEDRNKKLASPSGSQRKISLLVLNQGVLQFNKIKETIEKSLPIETKVKLPQKAYELYKKYYQDYTDMLNSLHAITGKFKTQSRLVVGLGDESVYETSIRLLRNYGVPYIPGSAIKGVTRHLTYYVLAEFINEGNDFYKRAKTVQDAFMKGDPKEILSNAKVPERCSRLCKEFLRIFGEKKVPEIIDELIRIFGTQKKEGEVVFFDAIPIAEEIADKPILELDIMNPHYGPYYQSGEKNVPPPGDWYDPIPIFFLTVPKDVPFLVAVGGRDRELTEKAFSLVKLALRDLGVGAKTSLGYGRLVEYV